MILRIHNIAPLTSAYNIIPQPLSDWYVKLVEIIAGLNVQIDNINDLQSQADDIVSKAEALAERVGTNENNILDLQGRMTTAEGNIESLDVRVGVLETDLANLKLQVQNNRQDIDSLISSVNTINGEIDEINSQIETINQTLTEHDTRITQNATDITELKAKDQEHDQEIQALKDHDTVLDGQVKALQDKDVEHDAHLSELDSDITRIDQKDEEQDGRLDSLENRADVLETKQAAHEKAIQVNAINISDNYEAIQEIKTEQADQNDQLTKHDQRITSLEKRADNTDNEFSELESQFTDLKAKFVALGHDVHDQLDNIRTAVSTNTSTIASLQSQVTLLNELYQELYRDHQEWAAWRPTVDSEIDHLNSDVADLQLEVQKFTALYERLSDTVGKENFVWTSTTENPTGEWKEAVLPGVSTEDVKEVISNYKDDMKGTGTEGQVWTKGQEGNEGSWQDAALPGVSTSDVKTIVDGMKEAGHENDIWTSTAEKATGEWKSPALTTEEATEVKGIVSSLKEGTEGQVWTKGSDGTGSWADQNITKEDAEKVTQFVDGFETGGTEGQVWTKGAEDSGSWKDPALTSQEASQVKELVTDMSGTGSEGQVWTKDTDGNGHWADATGTVIPAGQDGQVYTATTDNPTGEWKTPVLTEAKQNDVSTLVDTLKDTGTSDQVWTKGEDGTGSWKDAPALPEFPDGNDGELWTSTTEAPKGVWKAPDLTAEQRAQLAQLLVRLNDNAGKTGFFWTSTVAHPDGEWVQDGSNAVLFTSTEAHPDGEWKKNEPPAPVCLVSPQIRVGNTIKGKFKVHVEYTSDDIIGRDPNKNMFHFYSPLFKEGTKFEDWFVKNNGFSFVASGTKEDGSEFSEEYIQCAPFSGYHGEPGRYGLAFLGLWNDGDKYFTPGSQELSFTFRRKDHTSDLVVYLEPSFKRGESPSVENVSVVDNVLSYEVIYPVNIEYKELTASWIDYVNCVKSLDFNISDNDFSGIISEEGTELSVDMFDKEELAFGEGTLTLSKVELSFEEA